MRYGLKDFIVTRLETDMFFDIRIPHNVYASLEVLFDSSSLIGSHAQVIKNSIRKIADETTGGTILYASGSKMIGDIDPITNIEKKGDDRLLITLSLVPLIEQARADGDEEELAALNAVYNGEDGTGHMWSIEVDFGDEPMSNEIAQFFGLPAALPEGYEFMTAEEVCSTLEDIMTSMDLSLTPEQAQAITQQTLTQQ